jgi:hypothetical protein
VSISPALTATTATRSTGGCHPIRRTPTMLVHGFHAERCPLARSIGRSIDITTQVEYITAE